MKNKTALQILGNEACKAVFIAPILQERALDYMEYMNIRKLRNNKSKGIIAMKIIVKIFSILQSKYTFYG